MNSFFERKIRKFPSNEKLGFILRTVSYNQNDGGGKVHLKVKRSLKMNTNLEELTSLDCVVANDNELCLEVQYPESKRKCPVLKMFGV